MSTTISLSELIHRRSEHAEQRESLLKSALESFCQVERDNLTGRLALPHAAACDFVKPMSVLLDAMQARVMLLEESTQDHAGARAVWMALDMYKEPMIEALDECHAAKSYGDLSHYARTVAEIQYMMDFIQGRADIG